MNWLEIKNLQTAKVSSIPRFDIEELRQQSIEMVASGLRPVQFFGDNVNEDIILYIALADDDRSKIYVASAVFAKDDSYKSFTSGAPAFHLFEREFFEQYGILPRDHPWLKPVRKGIAGTHHSGNKYEFFKMEGREVHEVGVGPIHAGVIEPGHFRFSCFGEDVHHLEIELGFQHRGIEQLFIKNRGHYAYSLKLAESIAGDTVIGHAAGFTSAMESLRNISVSGRAMTIRTVAMELERIASHLGDLSALSNDVAYSTGSAVFGALRTIVINTTMAVCGNRFGRGLLSVGGVNYDISDSLLSKILNTMHELDDRIELAAGVLFSSSSVMARFEKTGTVDHDTARTINMVGPAARASGLSLDVRADHPYGGYSFIPVHKLTLKSGDVFARAYIRYAEIKQSLKIIIELLSAYEKGALISVGTESAADSFVISMSEGWRGEIVHTAVTDNMGNIKKYKIKDPSFNNWFALALSVRNNGISDFPLCNKSFNLSYSGFDL